MMQKICQNWLKKYANPFEICRILTGLYCAYLSLILYMYSAPGPLLMEHPAAPGPHRRPPPRPGAVTCSGQFPGPSTGTGTDRTDGLGPSALAALNPPLDHWQLELE